VIVGSRPSSTSAGLHLCGGLALANGQMPTQPLSPCPSRSTEEGEKIKLKSSWAEIKFGRSLIGYHNW